jgi:hypothetical protein
MKSNATYAMAYETNNSKQTNKQTIYKPTQQ